MTQEQEQDLCYICMDHQSPCCNNTVFADKPCNCKNIAIHRCCLFEQIVSGFNSCGACLQKFGIHKDGIKFNVNITKTNVIYYQSNQTSLYDGVVEIYGINMQLIKKTVYKENKKDGIEDLYKTTKKGIHYLASRISYSNNTLHGIYQIYYPNGVLDTQATYVNNVKHGAFIRRYENNVLMQSTTYNNGHIIGDFTSFYPNGSADIECTYKDGKIHGRYKKWCVNGSIHTDVYYDQGRIISAGAMHPELQEYNDPF